MNHLAFVSDNRVATATRPFTAYHVVAREFEEMLSAHVSGNGDVEVKQAPRLEVEVCGSPPVFFCAKVWKLIRMNL